MKRSHYAILLAQILSYALIVTFVFADMMFDLTGILRTAGEPISPSMAIIGGCLITLVGTINAWLTYYYMQKAQTLRDWVVVCAWTNRVKKGDRWLRIEDYLTETLGCQISHGLSEDALAKMRDDVDANWREMSTPATTSAPAAANRTTTADGTAAEGTISPAP